MSSPGQRICIVGGGLGIGFHVTKSILESSSSDTRVLVFGLHFDNEIPQLVKNHPSRLITLMGDVTSKEDRAKVVDTCVKSMGGIDTLVYCAGVIGPIARIDSADIGSVRKSYDVNVFGLMAMTQLCLPELRKSADRNRTNAAYGKIVIFSSACDAKVTYMGWATYCTSKAAVSRFVQCLAVEEPTLHIQGVYPKLTRTGMPTDIIKGKFRGIMADHEVERFKLWNDIGDAIVEPPIICAEAVTKLTLGKFLGGRSGEVMYYDEHVPDYRPKL